MGWFRRKPPPGIVLAGQHIGWPGSGIVVTGSSGRGKTHFSRDIQRQFIRQRMPIMVACAKGDEADEIEQLCREEGALSRFCRFTPGGSYTYDLMHESTRPPYGSTMKAVQRFEVLSDIAIGSEGGGGRSEKFWTGGKNAAFTAAIDLEYAATGRCTLEGLKDILISSPSNPEQAQPDVFFHPPKDKDGNVLLKADGTPQDVKTCARMIKRAIEADRPECRRRLGRALDFFAAEFCSMGEKARGAIMSMVNQTVAPFLVEPYYRTFNTGTNFHFEDMEREGLVVALDAPMLVYGQTPGRLFQLALILSYQEYCLARKPTRGRYGVIVRDECPNFTHPGYDALVAAQSRSQHLIHFDLFQDFDLMEATYGGGPKARNEAMSFYAQHDTKVMFGQNNVDSCEAHSKLIGSKMEVMPSGGCHPVEGDLWGEAMGVRSTGWSMAYQPILRPEFFARQRVGEAVIFADGRHRVVSFRRGR